MLTRAAQASMPMLRVGIRAFGDVAFGRGLKSKLSILIYHQVIERPDPIGLSDMDVETFRWQMRLLAECFNVLPLSEAAERLRAGTLPRRAAVVSFDDGYADNVEVALPVLRELGLPAVFFVTTGFLDGGRMWNDRVLDAIRVHQGERLDLRDCGFGTYELSNVAARQRGALALLEQLKYLPMDERAERVNELIEHLGDSGTETRMMTSKQVIELANAGMEIGGHTVNHPILARTDPSAARSEIAQGRETLEGIIGQPVTLFAYPNGRPGKDYAAEHVNMVRELGFQAAVSTAPGVSTSATDRFQLARFTPWDRSPWRFGVRMMLNARRTRIEAVDAPEGA